MVSKETKEELIINRYHYRDKEYITLKKKNGKVIKKFNYSDKKKNIKNISETKYTNEENIRYYYQKKSPEKYEPTTKNDYKEQLNNFPKNKRKSTLVFKNENRLVFTHQKYIKKFDYMYINAQVRVYFDGVYTIASGRSNYVYARKISDDEEAQALKQAIKRAIAPYGSNLKFKLINWNYVFHQEKYTDFK